MTHVHSRRRSWEPDCFYLVCAITALIFAVNGASALPISGGEADASAKWETVVVPSLPITDPAFAHQVAVIPVQSPDDHAVATGTAVVAENLGGAVVRGFSEVGFAAPNTRGGGSLEASSHARLISVYEATGIGPIDLDVVVHVDGTLEGGVYCCAPGDVTSQATYEAILHTSTGSTPLFTGEALFDIVSGAGSSALALQGDWTSADFASFDPGSIFNQGQRVDMEDENSNVAILSPGDQFAIELILDTSVFAKGAFEAAARANFDSTGGFTLSSDTPGASFVQLVVPEPTAIAMTVVIMFAAGIVARRRKSL